MPETTKRDLRWFWRDWCRPILLVVVVLGSFRSAIADWNDVPTGSMRPTILDGDRIYLNKMAYDLRVPFVGWRIIERHAPERGDIVIFPSPDDGRRLVKRVTAIEGDTIEIRQDRLILNGVHARYEAAGDPLLVGVPAEERRLREFLIEELDGSRRLIALTPARPSPASFGPYVVPEGKVFCMGDNRDDSFDSRFFGPVSRDSLRGQALAVAASVDPDHGYMPRWSRFFQSLRLPASP